MEPLVDPWFMREHAVLFAFAALASLLYLLERHAQCGRYMVPVLGTCVAALLAGVAALAGALVAHRTGQPDYVTFALVLTGALVVVSTTFGLAHFGRLYRRASRAAGTVAHERMAQS